VIDSITQAVAAGARPAQLGQALALAAATRVARFGTANEVGDWIGALHSFTYCNAVHQVLRRCPSVSLLPIVLHGAVSVYLNRFLNVPPAHLPGERDALRKGPADPAKLREEFLDLLDSQHKVGGAAEIVARYVADGHPAEPLLDTLVQAVAREDADFHTFQMVEAGIRQFQAWGKSPQGTTILIAIARYLAAHSPTQRGQWQTARIALRLHRGEEIYDAPAAE
jgi:hypothetical protein